MNDDELCRCGHAYRDHGEIIAGGRCQAGGCDPCEVFELPGIEVTWKEDGLWLTFGHHATISLDSILDGRGAITNNIVREFCERRATSAAEECPSEYTNDSGWFACQLPKGHSEPHQDGLQRWVMVGEDNPPISTSGGSAVSPNASEPVRLAAQNEDEPEPSPTDVCANCMHPRANHNRAYWSPSAPGSVSACGATIFEALSARPCQCSSFRLAPVPARDEDEPREPGSGNERSAFVSDGSGGEQT